jgi:hypothetical protein
MLELQSNFCFILTGFAASSGNENSSLGWKVGKSGDGWKFVGSTCYALVKASFRI